MGNQPLPRSWLAYTVRNARGRRSHHCTEVGLPPSTSPWRQRRILLKARPARIPIWARRTHRLHRCPDRASGAKLEPHTVGLLGRPRGACPRGIAGSLHLRHCRGLGSWSVGRMHPAGHDAIGPAHVFALNEVLRRYYSILPQIETQNDVHTNPRSYPQPLRSLKPRALSRASDCQHPNIWCNSLPCQRLRPPFLWITRASPVDNLVLLGIRCPSTSICPVAPNRPGNRRRPIPQDQSQSFIDCPEVIHSGRG